jgi:hydrogenase expression/formation protein HypC
MCIGTPLRLLDGGEFEARGAGRDGVRVLSLLLTGALPAGAWVLAQGNLAIRVIDAGEAALINDALAACEAAERGEDFEAGFADLIGREPQLPPWLQARQETTHITKEEIAHG